jgi:3-hydroxyisobutyrate dehydrogenase-like beta-hydroxyacid dehydrogenase
VIDSRQTVGILGLGLVGMALARRLCRLGFVVRGFDIVQHKQTGAEAAGVRWVSDPRKLLQQCSVLIIAVLDDNALKACTNSLLSAGEKFNSPKLVVSCVTAGQSETLHTAQKCLGNSVDFVDLPLLGSSQQIEDGQAIGLLGADPTVLECWRSALNAIAPNFRHIGTVGLGVAAKLACNLVLGLNRSALAEGMALAEGFGIDPHAFLNLLRGSPAYSKAVDVAGPRMATRDFEPLSRIRQHRKDMGLIIDAAQTLGITSFLSSAQAALLDEAIERGFGELDNVAVIAVYDRNLPGKKV